MTEHCAALCDVEVRAHLSRRLGNGGHAEVPYNLSYFMILIKIQASYIQLCILNLIFPFKMVLENFLIHYCLSFQPYSEVVMQIIGVTCRTVVKNATDSKQERTVIDLSIL